jgi:hypothetical protein
LQNPPKFTQIAIFGLKIYHLATLPELVAGDKFKITASQPCQPVSNN